MIALIAASIWNRSKRNYGWLQVWQVADQYLFYCSYDVILATPAQKVLNLFIERKYKILFSAEPYCWPERELAVGDVKVREILTMMFWSARLFAHFLFKRPFAVHVAVGLR